VIVTQKLPKIYPCGHFVSVYTRLKSDADVHSRVIVHSYSMKYKSNVSGGVNPVVFNYFSYALKIITPEKHTNPCRK
jgi:hypothetical protein